MSEPKRPTRKRARRQRQRGSQQAAENRQSATESPLSALEAIGAEAGVLFVDIFIENEGQELDKVHQQTLRKLAASGLDFNPLIDLVKAGTLSLPTLEDLLSKYKLVNLERIDGTTVRPPTSSELMIEANILLINEFASLRFPHFTQPQMVLLMAIAQDGYPVVEIINRMKRAVSRTLLSIAIATSAVEIDADLDKSKIFAFLTDDAPPDAPNGPKNDAEPQWQPKHEFGRAQRHGLSLPKAQQIKTEYDYKAQLSRIKKKKTRPGHEKIARDRLARNQRVTTNHNAVGTGSGNARRSNSADRKRSAKSSDSPTESAWTRLGNRLTPRLPAGVQRALSAVNLRVGRIIAPLSPFLSRLFAPLNTLFSKLDTLLTAIISWFGALIQKVSDLVSGFCNGVATFWKAGLLLPVSVLINSIVKCRQIISAGFQFVIQKVTALARALSPVNAVKEKMEQLQSRANTAAEPSRQAYRGAVGKLNQTVKQHRDNIEKKMTDAKDAARDAAKDALSAGKRKKRPTAEHKRNQKS